MKICQWIIMINKTQERILKLLYVSGYSVFYLAELKRALKSDYKHIWNTTMDLKKKGLIEFSTGFKRKEGKVCTLTDKGNLYAKVLIKCFK